MDAQTACAYCWESFSSAVSERVPRLLDCGHSLCTGCLGRIIVQDLRKGLRCPSCGTQHNLAGQATATAVPQNLALLDSMQRLQLVGPVGGLLPPEKVVLGIQQIGSSPHSTVYTSVLKLQKEQIQVAAKKLPTGQVPAEAFTEFTQHLQMLAFATRTCTKLCPLLGFIVTDGTVCLVMHLYQQSLQQLLASSAGGTIALAEAAGIALQVLQGLEELHTRNIVHNNLKPSNILLDQLRQDAVLSDFGVSTVLHKLPNVPVSKASMHYMSPELVDVDPIALPSFPADVWSFAAVLLQCLTGKRPFEGERSVIKAHIKGKAPGAIPDSLPQSLQKVLGQCFNRDPAQRPKLSEIRQVLEAVLLPAGDPMWSPSSRQLALAQHPLDKDLGMLMAVQPAQAAPAVAPSLQSQQQQQQQQLGPQVDIVLERSIKAAQQAAEIQVPCIDAAIAELRKPLPRTCASLSHDLQPLSPQSAEFKELSALMSSAQAPVYSISLVVVPERESRFAAWKASLPVELQSTSRVFHGTTPLSNAQSIARRGPDFSLIGSANGHVHGRGFYTTPDIRTATYYAKATGGICVCKAVLGNVKSGGSSDDTAGSLLQQHYHSVVAADNKITVLFHPDSVFVQYIINEVADASAERELALKQEQLDAEWRDVDLGRQKQLQEQHGRLKMLSYFQDTCTVFLRDMKAHANKAGLDRVHTLFQLESLQFQQALPMYAVKPDFLSLLKQKQCVVLTAAAGTGKSVSVPQWIYDSSHPDSKVAVLVPHASAAENLAQHVSRLRGCIIGQQVGSGAAGRANVSEASRIVYMTYSFFSTISAADADLSAWCAVILDEAHGHKSEADAVFLRVTAACKARRDFKMVVMSPFIDPHLLAGSLHKRNVSTAVLEVPGVVFPIKDEWFCEETWNSTAPGAIQSLALECVRVYLQEKQGNLLVFMSTVGGVTELVQALQLALAHDSGCVVLGLYAALNDAEQAKVISFDDLSRFPQNRGKRMICVSTNMAEAGVTIPGVNAVLETGWQMQSVYDQATRSTAVRQVRISKATQQRRRSLAGRTASGTCYTVYSQACYVKDFPDHSTPEILRSNLDAFLLGLVASGLTPGDSLELLNMEQARSSLEASKQHLLKFGAITEAANGHLSATQLGHVLASLPISMEFGISLVASVQLNCSHEVAVIACMATAAGNRVFHYSCKPSQSAFAAQSGDPEAYLNIYQAWLHNGKSEAWCNKHGLVAASLVAADDMLSRVVAAMTRCQLAVSRMSVSMGAAQRSDAIMQSLTAGFYQQTATAASLNNAQGQFFITDQYQTNPTSAVLHNRSTLSAADGNGIGMVLYFERVLLANGKHVMAGVGKVQPQWVVAAASFDAQIASSCLQAVQATERGQFSAAVTTFPTTGTLALVALFTAALDSNVDSLAKLFPLAVFQLDKSCRPPQLTVSCPKSMKTNISVQVAKQLSALQLGVCSLPVQGIAGLQSAGGLPPVVQQLQQSLQGQALQVEYRAASAEVVITAFQNVMSSVQQKAGTWLGLASQPRDSQCLSGPTASHEQQVVSLLQSGKPADIIARFGPGKKGSLLVLAHLVLSRTSMWLYGGFIRDLVLRGDVHGGMDLDVGLPKTGLDASGGMSSIAQMAAEVKMQFVSTNPQDPRVVRGFFKAVDSSVEIEVQVVDTEAFAKRNPEVDFDVNNLKLTQTHTIEIKALHGQRKEATDLKQVLANIRDKQLYVLRPVASVNGRIEKMKSRGWKIMFPA